MSGIALPPTFPTNYLTGQPGVFSDQKRLPDRDGATIRTAFAGQVAR